ncbi:MAG: GtrA family protein [Paracoccaceae bacterium]
MRDLRKVLTFGFVGVAASILHFITAVVTMRVFGAPILLANLIGFIVAFGLSYVGHYKWTFQSSENHKVSVPKFAITAVTGYLINNVVLIILISLTGVEHSVFILIAIAVSAAVVYLISSRWIFGGRR